LNRKKKEIKEKDTGIFDLFFFSFLNSDRLSLLLTTTNLTFQRAHSILAILVVGVLVSRQPRVTVSDHRSILLGEINALTVLDVVTVALRESTRALRQTRLNHGLGVNPVTKSILAILDDGPASVVPIVGLASLTGGHGGVIDQVEEVLAVAGDDGDLLAVLAEGIELVLECGLDLLTGDVGQLGLGNQGLSFGTDKLLLQDDDAGRVGILVLELGDLVGDLLLACAES
jgi:hypothetical protein